MEFLLKDDLQKTGDSVHFLMRKCCVCDGQNIALVTQDSLRRAIGIVPQDSILFNNTLENNIKYGRVDATDEEIIVAAPSSASS